MILKTKLIFLILVVVFSRSSVYAEIRQIYLTSPFSYHIVKEVTKFHLYNLVRDISERGYKAQFLNETEYSNIVHALEMRTGEFLRYGDKFIARITTDASAAPIDPFLNDFLQQNNITDSNIWMYLKDIKGTSEETTTIRMINLGIRTEEGHSFDFTLGSHIRISSTPPALSYQIHGTLLRSLENLLRRENIPPGHTLTLYLKDFNLTNTVIDDYRNIERINIGIIVEDKDRKHIRDIDWIIEETRPQLIHTAESITTSMISSFHESAHELVRRILIDDMSNGTHLSILPSISLVDGIWMSQIGVAEAEYTLTYFTRARQISQIAVLLAGEVAEKIVINNNNYNRDITDANNALAVAYTGICLGLGLWQPDVAPNYCPKKNIFYLSYQEWSEWRNRLPEAQQQLFIQNADEWMDEARLLARDVLMRNSRVLENMTNLILRKNTLNTQDLEVFYGGFPQMTSPIPRPEELLTQTPPLFGDTSQINVLNWNLSLLSSLVPTSAQNFKNTSFRQDQNFENGTIDILDGLRRVEVTEYLRPYIRQAPMEHAVQPTYAHGLSSLYIKECIKTITDFYSHL